MGIWHFKNDNQVLRKSVLKQFAFKYEQWKAAAYLNSLYWESIMTEMLCSFILFPFSLISV